MVWKNYTINISDLIYVIRRVHYIEIVLFIINVVNVVNVPNDYYHKNALEMIFNIEIYLKCYLLKKNGLEMIFTIKRHKKFFFYKNVFERILQ